MAFPPHNIVDPYVFTIEFIRRFRSSKGVLNEVSLRQAVAIPRFMSAIFFRRGELLLEDYIRAAVVTSPPEDQKLAERIAESLLFYTEDEEEAPEEVLEQDVALIAETDLSSVLATIQQELQFIENVDLKKLQATRDYLKNLRAELAQRNEPYTLYTDTLRELGFHLPEIALANVSTDQELLHFLQAEILDRLGSLTPTLLEQAAQLELGSEICKRSPSPIEQIGMRFLQDLPPTDIGAQITSLAQDNLVEAAKTLQTLDKLGFDPVQKENLAHAISKRIQTIDDVFNLSKILESIPIINKPQVLENTVKSIPIQNSMEMTLSLDRSFNQQLAPDLLSMYLTMTSSTDMDHTLAASIPFYSKELAAALNQRTQALVNQLQNESPLELQRLALECAELSQACKHYEYSKQYNELASKVGNTLLHHIETPISFKTIVEHLLDKDIRLDTEQIWSQGRAIGLTDIEIAELVNATYKLLKTLVETKQGDFQSLSRLLKKLKLADSQLQELTQIASKVDHQAAFSALTHFDLGRTLKFANQLGNHAVSQALESLTAGPGTNLLSQWFLHRTTIPYQIKHRVKELVKQMLLDLAIEYSSRQFGNTENGLIPATRARPMRDGDDFELVDVEETLDVLLSKGKRPEMLDINDLMVKESRGGKTALICLLDISGSMAAQKLAYCALTTVMLIYTLIREELAIALFESNTHPIKALQEHHVDLEQVAENLLDLNARGGTMISRAVDWAIEQLAQSDSREKIFVILSDFVLYDDNIALNILKNQYWSDVHSFLVAVERSYSVNTLHQFKNVLAGHKILLRNKIENIPHIVSDIINKALLFAK